ncbi:4Fe-4S binding protein [Candidatus Falkowbacteria bacterium]|nr:4Fe-4S binding protein [Candidatus Falkowbacteria bacterium]
MKINLAVSPGTTKDCKTGNWRVYYPLIDHEKCIACGTCARVCPEGCVFPVKDEKSKKIYFEKDLDYCKGCGICAEECLVKAITMELERR